MKKIVGFLMIASFIGVNASFALPLPPIPSPFTGVLKGESDMYRSQTNEHVFVDWIVSDHDLVPQTVSDSDFVFSILTNDPPNTRGDKAAYDASTYYYYYQLENDNVFNNNFMNSMSLDLDPGIVLSAGYIVGLDLDNDLTESHNLTGEVENNTNGEISPDSSKFTPIGSTPHQNWSFDLAFGEETTVFFLSCFMPPEYSPASTLSGAYGYDGYLPIPTAAIPEPMTMLLLGSGVFGMFLRRKRK